MESKGKLLCTPYKGLEAVSGEILRSPFLSFLCLFLRLILLFLPALPPYLTYLLPSLFFRPFLFFFYFIFRLYLLLFLPRLSCILRSVILLFIFFYRFLQTKPLKRYLTERVWRMDCRCLQSHPHITKKKIRSLDEVMNSLC